MVEWKTKTINFCILIFKQPNFMSSEEFNTAVVRLYDTIKPYAVSLTKNMIDAEDLIQDTMTRASRYKDNFKHNTNLKSWL